MSRGRSSFGARLALAGLAAFFAWTSSASAALSPTAGPVAAVDDRKPTPPINVAAVANLEAQQADVTWELSLDDVVRQSPAGDDFTSGGTFVNTNDVAFYLIWRTAGSEDPAVVDTVSAGKMSYVDPDVENGVEYIYEVTAVDAGGNASDPVASLGISFGPAGEAETELPEGAAPVVQEVTMKLDVQLSNIDELDVAYTALDDALAAINAAYSVAYGDANRAHIAGGSDADFKAAIDAAIDARDAAIDVARADVEATYDPETKEFTANFITAIADLLGIDPARITITRLSKGSVIVDFEIADDPDSPASDAVAELNNLAKTDPQIFADAGLGTLLEFQTSQTTSVSFGTVGADADASTTLSYTNSSTDPEAILIVSTSLEGVGFFAFPAKLTLRSGESGSIDISFAASDVGNVNGEYSGALTIVTNDPNNSLTVISLSATVVGGQSGAVADVSTTVIKFPRTTVDDFSSRDLTITNKGGLPLGITISISGDDAISLSDEGTFSLAAGESKTIEVVFAPTEAIASSADIMVMTDDSAHPHFAITASGTGVPAGGPPRLIAPDGNEIFGDFDGDASVTFDDFFQFADNFGLTSASSNWNPAFDLSGDDAVTFDDFFIFADNFGKSGTYESAGSAAISFAAALDGAQESTDTGSAGTGFGEFSYTDAGGLTYDITVEGLTGAITASHFHKGALGVSGGVVHAITFVEGPTGTWTSSGTWNSSNGLTPALVDDLKAGSLYVNVHTAAHPSGEIRGQIEE